MEAIGRTLEKLSTFEKDAARNPEAAEHEFLSREEDGSDAEAVKKKGGGVC